MNKLKIIFFGTPDYVIPVLETLHRDFNLVGVVTSPDAPVGRKGLLTASAVKKISNFKFQISNLFTPNQFTDALINQLSALNPDLFVVASYGKIIPKAVLDIPKYGSINIHPSTLPKYKGPSPIQSAILNGEGSSGITFILMDEKMDHGPILFHEPFRFSQQDNFDTLSKGMFQRASELISEVIIGYINGSIKPSPQDDSKTTFCKMIKKEGGYFEINSPPSPEVLDRMIRAYYPWPTAWTKWDGKIVKLLPARNASSTRSAAGGPNQMIQMEGKKPTSLKDFLNGYPNFPIKTI